MERLTIELDHDTFERLRSEADARGRTVEDEARERLGAGEERAVSKHERTLTPEEVRDRVARVDRIAAMTLRPSGDSVEILRWIRDTNDGDFED